MDLRPGTFVTDNVRLERLLREGAMGQVWVAEHLTLELHVAVKFMSKKLTANEGELRARFIREAATAAKIKSPHVVQTHDQGFMSDGTPYIVMELLEGESLADRLSRDGSIGLPETGQIVLQVSKALSRAHGLGIVHRDIKPENIFLCRGEDGLIVKVLDFGIASHTELPESGWDEADTLAGTPQYLSPELFKEYADLDGQADLWALAVVAYRCLTGRLPFAGQTLGLLSLSVLSGDHERPSSIRSDVPAVVDAWFTRAFARDKESRFPSAKELA
ncbi:MAG: serine/threonine protein kinase, partial [Deltaproteobacteria bacterium]|nr:serine/threonine protein kinase [Deltaproteobacteria bacterium]MBW2530421.1 serine/threonine protein kinase [Deltaproteobacteria bacterium]